MVNPVHMFVRREWYHREMLFEKGLSVRGREARPGDLIISGDLDEIPRPAAVQALRSCEWVLQPGYHDCAVLEGSFFYYSFSWYAGMHKTPNTTKPLTPLTPATLTARCWGAPSSTTASPGMRVCTKPQTL